MRTSKVAGWICSQSVVTCVRRVLTKSVPSGLSVARKSPHQPTDNGLQNRVHHFTSIYLSTHLPIYLQMGGFWAAEHDWGDVHTGEGGLSPLGYLVKQLQVWPPHVSQARPHGELVSTRMEDCYILGFLKWHKTTTANPNTWGRTWLWFWSFYLRILKTTRFVYLNAQILRVVRWRCAMRIFPVCGLMASRTVSPAFRSLVERRSLQVIFWYPNVVWRY